LLEPAIDLAEHSCPIGTRLDPQSLLTETAANRDLGADRATFAIKPDLNLCECD